MAWRRTNEKILFESVLPSLRRWGHTQVIYCTHDVFLLIGPLDQPQLYLDGFSSGLVQANAFENVVCKLTSFNPIYESQYRFKCFFVSNNTPNPAILHYLFMNSALLRLFFGKTYVCWFLSISSEKVSSYVLPLLPKDTILIRYLCVYSWTLFTAMDYW